MFFYSSTPEAANNREIPNLLSTICNSMSSRDSNYATNDAIVSVKQEAGLIASICAGCGHKIADKYIMRVAGVERSYHEDCIACAVCSSPLSHSCFFRDLKIYCRVDYQRIYGAKCARCVERISHTDFVMKAAGLVFHVDCFVCYMCGQALLKGAQYVLRQGQPICRRDYEHEFYLSSSQDDDLLDDTRPRDGRRGPKRPRTILTSAQRRQFKASFELSPKPCRKVREALAKDTGLSVRVVQVWFQNQRAKMKKLQRKAKTDLNSEKDSKDERRTDSPHSDHSHYLKALSGRDGESSSFSTATQPLNPNNPYSPEDTYPGNSGDSFCSSDVSLDGTEVGFEMGDNENTVSDNMSQGQPTTLAGSSHDSSSTLTQSLHTAIHNPIDKLFMMQNSYFSSDHI